MPTVPVPYPVHVFSREALRVDPLKGIGGQVWRFDSLKQAPESMSDEDYVRYVNKHRAAQPLRFADDMRVPSSSSSSGPGVANGSPVLPMATQDTQNSSSSGTHPVVVDVEEEPPAPMEVEAADGGMELITLEGHGGGGMELSAIPPVSMVVDAPGGQPPGDSNAPALMIAEQHRDGAKDAQEIIRQNYMERGFVLECMALDARAEFESALQSRGGQ